MITPEEVYNFSFDTIDWGPPPHQAAVVNLGKSDWLNRFAQTHLVRCSHFRLMFYDQIIDFSARVFRQKQAPTPAKAARSAVWRVRRAFAFIEVSMACGNGQRNWVDLQLIGAFSSRLTEPHNSLRDFATQRNFQPHVAHSKVI
jgi:hypothetical protein